MADQIAQYSSTDIKLHFVAYIDLVLDDIERLDIMFQELSPVAVKINGIGCGCGYQDITADHIQLFKKYNLPLIIHTAYEHICMNPRMHAIIRSNSAYDWARLLNTNQLRSVLNHGATLDMNAIKLVNSTDDIRIAVGPDKVTSANDNRLYWSCENDPSTFLRFLKQNVDGTKLIYDADFHWNVPVGEEDYASVLRIRQIFSDQSEQDAVLYQNAKEFFGMK